MRAFRGFLGLLFLTTGLIAFGPPAGATQIAYEGFGPSFPTYADGGSGFGGPWTPGGFNAFSAGYVPKEGSLHHSGLRATGGSVFGPAFPSINGAIRNLAQPLGQDNTTVYLSVLLEPEGKLDDGLFGGFFGLTLNGDLGNDLFIGKPGGGAQEEYVLETRGGTGQVRSGVPTKVGCPALVVVKADFLPGNDVFTLSVNPHPGGHESHGGVVKSDVDLGVVSAIGIYSTGSFVIDEIRIGTSLADVLPIDYHFQHRDQEGCHDDDDR